MDNTPIPYTRTLLTSRQTIEQFSQWRPVTEWTTGVQFPAEAAIFLATIATPTPSPTQHVPEVLPPGKKGPRSEAE